MEIRFPAWVSDAVRRKVHISDVYDAEMEHKPKWYAAEWRRSNSDWTVFMCHQPVYEDYNPNYSKGLDKHFAWFSDMERNTHRDLKSPVYYLIRANGINSARREAFRLFNIDRSCMGASMNTPLSAESAIAAYSNPNDVRLARLHQTKERIEAEILRLASRPEEPTADDDDGPVIFFRKTFGNPDKSWTYAALRIPSLGCWVLTGAKHQGKSFTWQGLLDFIENSEAEMPEIWLATGWDQI